jgi:magnesium chelatase family protein
VPGTELRRRFPPQPEALRVLGEAMDRGTLSARGADRVLKLAWTIADLADKDRPAAEEVGYALALWTGSAQ